MKMHQILVVEDDAFLAVVLSELLVGMGHTVCEIASTQAGAVAAVVRHNPDLMIVDETLSEGDGVSVVEDILRAGMFVAHVFVSGNPGRVHAHKPGSVVVRKPFRLAELVGAMETALAVVGVDA
jgi:CheY-like chemotaxis protein